MAEKNSELSDLELEQVAGGLIRKEVKEGPGPGGAQCTPQGPLDHGGLLDPFATDGLLSKVRVTTP